MGEQLELFNNIEKIQTVVIRNNKQIDGILSANSSNAIHKQLAEYNETISLFKPIYLVCKYESIYHYIFNKIKKLLDADSLQDGNYHFYHNKIHFVLMSYDK